MTMYLPNPAVRPTGYEAGEFIDGPSMAEQRRATLDPIEPGAATPTRLDDHLWRDLARQADGYIAALVAQHDGTGADRRSVIEVLYEDRFADDGLHGA
jgi:hypothetical protein